MMDRSTGNQMDTQIKGKVLEGVTVSSKKGKYDTVNPHYNDTICFQRCCH